MEYCSLVIKRLFYIDGGKRTRQMSTDVAWQSRVIIRMLHMKNVTNQSSCGMKRFIDIPLRIVLKVVMHLRERLIQLFKSYSTAHR